MAKSKVHKDRHGIFIRVGGHIFRPDFPVGYKHNEQSCGSVKEGDKVNARHIGGTSLASLKNPETGAEEHWYSHGCYYSYSPKVKVPSEDLFRPDCDRW